MLKPQVVGKAHNYAAARTNLLQATHKAFIHAPPSPATTSTSLAIVSRPWYRRKHRELGICYISSSPAGDVEAIATAPTDQKETTSTAENKDIDESISVKAVVTVQPTVGGFFKKLGIDRGLDDIQDLLGKTLLLELVSAELDASK